MSFRPVGSSNDAAASGSAPADKSSELASFTPVLQGPQTPAQLQQQQQQPQHQQASSSTSTSVQQPQQYYGYSAATSGGYDGQGQYPQMAYGGTGYTQGYDYAAAGYAGYDAYSAYGGSAGYYGAGGSGSFGTTDEEMAAQQSIYTPGNASQQQQKTKAAKGQARRTVLRKGAGEVWEDATLMEWDPTHFRLFVGDLGNDVNDDDLIKAFGPDKGWKSFSKAKVVRDKVTNKTRGYGFVSYADPEDMLAAWKAMNGKYVGSRPVKIQKANTGVRQVDIGDKKAKELDTKKKNRVIGNKVRGAIVSSSWQPHIRR